MIFTNELNINVHNICVSGQRAVITCTPEYGYGIAGVYPLVPPNAHLIFDVTLLGFRPRPVWIKTLIQV